MADFISKDRKKALAVLGPTASGKTSLAVRLCRQFGGEVVGADSRQVYRGLDIGTGKDLGEFSSGGPAVPYHLIDVAEPGSTYNLKLYLDDARSALDDIFARGRLPVLAGGSSLYVDALLRGYILPGPPPDEALRERLAKSTAPMLLEALEGRRPPSSDGGSGCRPRLVRALEGAPGAEAATFKRDPGFDTLLIGVFHPRPEIHRRIEARLDARLQGGLLEEVQALLDRGVPAEWLDRLGLEYRHASQYIKGTVGLAEMRRALLAGIRGLAKAQDGWFRKMEREGAAIYWLGADELSEAAALVSAFLAGEPLPAPRIRMMELFYGPRQ